MTNDTDVIATINLATARENFYTTLYAAIRSASLDVSDVTGKSRQSHEVSRIVGGWLADFLKEGTTP